MATMSVLSFSMTVPADLNALPSLHEYLMPGYGQDNFMENDSVSVLK